MTDSAVAGEAAGIGMGLIFAGISSTGSQKAIEEMLTYAHDTQHEKIIRGLALGIALITYGKEEEADTLIEQLLRDKVKQDISILCDNVRRTQSCGGAAYMQLH